MYGYPDQVPRGVTPVGLLSDEQLRLCGYDPVTIRRMEEELAEMGLGLGLEGIFGTLWKGVKGAAKGVAKGVTTVAKVAKPLAPVISTFVPGGRLIEAGITTLAPDKKPRAQVPVEPSRHVPMPVPSGVKPKSFLERLREAVTQHAPSVLPQIVEQIAPTPPPAPAPAAPIVITAPGPAPTAAAGVPGWILPVALGVGALALLRR